MSKKEISPALKAIAWANRHQQDEIIYAIAIYGYPSLKPLLEILMEDKPCQ